MYKNEVIIRLLDSLAHKLPIDYDKTRPIIENILYDYQISKAETALTVISDLKEKIFLYLACRRQDGLSEETLKNYQYRLTRFANTVQKNVEDITSMDIRKYLMLYQQHVKPCNATLAGELSGLKSFFTWLEDQDYINKSPAKKIPQPKVEKRLRKPLSPEELEVIRDTCKTYRERAMLECFYSTGGRLDEIEKLNKDDINWQDLSLNVIGKGNKERQVYISPKAKVHIRKYILSRTDETDALFVTQRRPYRRLGHRAMEKEIAKIGERAGLSRNIFPHLLRHTVATDMLNNGADLVTVQNYLGHEDPATTQVYAKLNKEDVKIAHRKFVQ